MLTGVNLPDVIMPEILARLPAKTLGRFKLVSKPWRTLISDPKFIKTHLSRYNAGRRSKLLLLSKRQHRSLSVIDFNGEPFVSSNLKFEQIRDVFGSCHGLVLAQNTRLELVLLNPTTYELKKLPSPPGADIISGRFTCGFGYDSSTDDYKVVVITRSKIVNVYRLKSNLWYTLQDPACDRSYSCYFNNLGVFVNGCLNWFGSISESLPITALDLAEDKFRKVPLPPPSVVGGRRQGSNRVNVNDIATLVVKEYGVYESQTDEYGMGFYMLVLNPLIVLGNDEFAVTTLGFTAAFNVKEGSARNIVVRGLSGEEEHKCTFVESLVSLDQLR